MDASRSERTLRNRDRGVALLLALLAGSIGLHHFYLGQKAAGVASILFCWTGAPALVSLVDAIRLAVMSRETFDRKYRGLEPGEVFSETKDRTADQVFEVAYSEDEAARFQTVAHALSKATADNQLAFVAGKELRSAQLLVNPLTIDDARVLPTLTVQASGYSLLLTPRQVVVKLGGALQLARHTELSVELREAGTYHAPAVGSTTHPSSPKSVLAGVDQLMAEANSLISSFFQGKPDKKRFQGQIQVLFTKLNLHGQGQTFYAQYPLSAQELVPQERTELVLCLKGLELRLAHADPGVLHLLESELRYLLR